MTREDHKARLVAMIKTLHKLAQLCDLEPVDAIGVKGFNSKVGKQPVSLNDIKSQWYLSHDGYVVQKLYYGMRPSWLKFKQSLLEPVDLRMIDQIASIQYAKKTREIWYNTWDSSCPRFSVKEIEDAFSTQTLLSLEVLERLFGNAE